MARFSDCTVRQQMLKNVTAQLLKETNQGNKIVAEVSSDAGGSFDIKKVKPGNYIFRIKSDFYVNISTRIKILKSSKQRKDKLLVRLEPETTKCCAGEIRVQKSR